MLAHAAGRLRLVLLSRGEPALDLHRFAVAGELLRVSEADLVMDDHEVAEVLRLGGASSLVGTVAAVADRTRGWACGVRRAAVALEAGASVADALDDSDRALEDHLAIEVLGELPASVRNLLVWTSLIDAVPPEAVRLVLGADSDGELDRVMSDLGMIQRSPDGSLTCHPLLRDAARALLPLERPAAVGEREAHAGLVRWLAGHDEPEAAVELCLAAGDWPLAAALLVESHAVPRLVSGTADPWVRRATARAEVKAAEPLLNAAVILARRDLLAAQVAVTAATCDPGPREARALAGAFLELGLARFSGRPVQDLELLPRARQLLAQASVVDRADLVDLAACLDAFAGAVELASGEVDPAIVTLTRGADLVGLGGGARQASLDCAGQLALLEAYLGDLDLATRRAGGVLQEAAGEPLAGVAHAHVAMAWVLAERGQSAEAQVRLELARDRSAPSKEPWLAVTTRLVEARLMTTRGRPDEAIRIAAFRGLSQAPIADWLAGLVTVVTAEAMLAAGEPQQALAAVTMGLPAGSPERSVLTATARRDIGDVRGAAAAMASAADDLLLAPRATQLQGWVLQARLAFDRGESHRANLLVERVLRVASAEEFRRPLHGDGEWLRWFLDRDGSALRTHRPFVRSLLGTAEPSPRGRASWVSPEQALLEPLTERETQVLELLAQMCSTDEIAAELFVSVNTVKTHLKGIFRKYAVKRRVDAVRRGRELGVC